MVRANWISTCRNPNLGGFFGGAAGKGITEPTKLIWLLYIGAIILLISLLILGIGLNQKQIKKVWTLKIKTF